MQLYLVAIDRDLRAGSNIAAEGHALRKPAVDALRGWPPPSRLFRHGAEHRHMLGMVRHQLAPELERGDAAFLRRLIDKAFEIDGAVVDVHAAPETRIEVPVAHGRVDE